MAKNNQHSSKPDNVFADTSSLRVDAGLKRHNRALGAVSLTSGVLSLVLVLALASLGSNAQSFTVAKDYIGTVAKEYIKN